MNDNINQFRNAMYAAGLTPPEVIEACKRHRFPGMDKQHGNTAGWCWLFDDGTGGAFGDWSTGLVDSWQAKREKPYSPAEREAFKRKVDEAKKQNEIANKEMQNEAASKANTIWNSATPAPENHPYLVNKGIKPHGAKLHDGKLVIPLRADGVIYSLQFIDADGNKRFLTGGRVAGCYFRIGNIKDTTALCIAEGFATGATIHEATGYPVAVAFNAGNLLAVAKTMREKFPNLKLILCADNDSQTKGNPGLTKATEAARAVGGWLAIPDFGSAAA